MSFLQTPDGARLRWTVQGEGPETIVLVHGWKGSHRLWDAAIPGLAESFRVIAFDNRGMGESDKPVGRYDFDLLADDLGFVLECAEAERVTLVGWSMGCSIALQYLQRGGGRADRLALVNGPIKLESCEGFPWGLPAGELPGVVEELRRGWPGAELEFARGAVLDPDEPYADLYYRAALQMPLADSLRIVGEQALLDHRPVLAKLRLPVLALYGGRDPYYDRGLAEYIVETVEDGRLEIFEASAHSVHHDETERFVGVISSFARGEL